MSIRLLRVFWPLFLIATPGELLAGSEGSLIDAIQAQNERFMYHYRAGDAAAITELHTQHATVIAPNLAPVKGHKEIELSLATELALGDGTIDFKAQEVTRVSADTAYELGRYKFRLDLPEGGTIVDEGSTVVIWKLGVDEVWRIHVDIWNSNLPPSLTCA